MKSEKHTNSLINESSPYLLQHAHNPVNWYPWGSDILEKAVADNKLIIISVGYAACHWCHVMEHESFEDEDVAEIMNTHYYNIKVDREERPDVDMVYMSAVQIMTGSGGWPMNIVALPDGRPVWGGTYFRKEDWKNSLLQIAKLYKENPEKLYEYADKLNEGLKNIQLIASSKSENDIDLNLISEKLEKNFDWQYGGTKQTPKFVIPSNFEFLLKYSQLYNHKNIKDFVKLSLTKISFGGIYDHIEGGFSRYSVDEKWHIPHFEKMLYDNAQMVSLYSKAYAVTKIGWYREVVEQTLEFIENNLKTKEGSFYSSLDADSIDKNGKLREGAFYTWEVDELKELLKDEFSLFKEYYNVNSYGKWEDNEYVLIRTEDEASFLNKNQLDSMEFKAIKAHWLEVLSSEERNKREKPRLDDKQLTSWNALMLSGYVDAYKITQNKDYLATALQNATFIQEHLYKSEGNLHRSFKNGISSINGYLEDYAFTIEAFIKLYEITLDFEWLHFSKKLMDYSIQIFYEPETGLFYFTSKQDKPLITRNYELSDNVIPASNSVMAQNLFKLSKYFEEGTFLNISEEMINAVTPQLEDYPQGYSNWLSLHLNFNHSFYEVVIMGPNAKKNTARA
ncbi:thioredoxin domain-containing protein [Gillisia marina]|uniref:thioredoxin domain-containing protein n=1 Tax=Gillisia marina TaxID=1167637 RepID=UPI00029AE040|nr:thioredoxin domain-containing protein [Gillisia marina]